MLGEELIDLTTYCLQNPDSTVVSEKHKRIIEIGHEIYVDGGIDALENFFFVLKNRITEEIEKDPPSCVRYGMALLMNGDSKFLC